MVKIIKTIGICSICHFIIGFLFTSAFADIIDPGPYPGNFPNPAPAPTPEPVDDGEVVVIKVLMFVLALIVIATITYMNYKKSRYSKV